MPKKIICLFIFFILVINHVIFSQTLTLDNAISNAAREVSETVPRGTMIAVLNIESDYSVLSDYIINELIANLVNTGLFRVLPRSTVELEAARQELGFQMSGYVSDESQRRIGQFLGAETILTGTVIRDSPTSHRLVLNAIVLETFTYQSSYRISVQEDSQVRTLIVASGGFVFEDYSLQQRLGMGAMNMFFGAGSISNGQRLGWVVTGVQAAGITFILVGRLAYDPEFWENRNERFYNSEMAARRTWVTAGAVAIGAGVVFGYIIPFFHQRPNPSVAQSNFPFNLELVSQNDRDLSGFRLSYNLRF